MVLEATIICIVNSEWMRNGDYSPTRFQALSYAVNVICGAKTQFNSENTVGILTMDGKGVRVLVTPTSDLGKILACMHACEKVGILKGVNVVARRVCSIESGNSNWINEQGVSSSGSSVGGRLMKNLGGGVRSNGVRFKEFSSRGVDNDGAYIFLVAMEKKAVFIELNSGSSKHDREVDAKRGLFVVLKEMSCMDGVKSMAWLDDSLILGTDNVLMFKGFDDEELELQQTHLIKTFQVFVQPR
ncbi:uncharacterized protein LOC110691480 [Chenopodium quinoa]|uniref:uncharacterized protein LOC110691480 n=1 Tax=Chenopodium quinoa TaxID=63459 RepID=UPI000B77B501|nr:uncharacterized protein LOC110691480 [Chenopodium quinoa]